MKRILSLLAVAALVALGACQPEPVLSVSPDSLSFSESGGSQTVQISANYPWTASVSGSGFSVSPSSGEGNGTVTVTAAAASSPDAVTGTLSVRSEGLSASVSLSQSAKPTLILGDGAKVPAEGGSVELQIQYNTDYIVEVEASAQSWIKFIKTKSLSSGKLEFEISPNEGDERSGKVTVRDGSGKAAPVTATITQAAETKVLVVGDAATVPAEGATVEVDVQYNVDYSVEVEETAQSWIHYVETKSVHSGKLVFKVEANEKTEERSGKVTVKDASGGVEPLTITFVQKGESVVLTVGDTEIVPPEGGILEVSVRHNTDYTVTVEGTAKSWIHYVETKTVVDGILVFSIDENEGEERSGEVTLADVSGTVEPVTITIVQQAEHKVLVVGEAARVPSEGATVEVDIEYNVDYAVEIESSAQSWIHYVETKTVQSGKLVFMVDENETTDERSGKVTLKDKSGEADPVTFTITQDEKLVIILGETAVVPATGGSLEIAVEYNTDYTVTVEGEAWQWIRVVRTKSVMTGIIQLYVYPNYEGERRGKVTVADKGGKLDPITFEVIQEPGFIPVTSISLDKEEITVEKCEEFVLIATIEPENATNQDIIWESSDNQVVSVMGGGRFYCYELGRSTISASIGDVSAICEVTVVEPAFVAKERAVLETFYRANNGDGWYRNDNWCTDKPLNDWYGVSTDYRGHVKGIGFWNNNLSGYIPGEIGDLTELEELNLTNNVTMLSGYGPIPEEIGKLRKLKSLQLQGYTLCGKIPGSLADLTELETLLISNTRFLDPSPFPPGVIGNLRKLRVLNLVGVDLTGLSLSDFGSLYDLESLRLTNNGLTGTIPESFGNLKNLHSVDLSSNHLSGIIPSSLQTVDNYWKLWPGFVSDNQFTMEDLRASACPAPRSPLLKTVSGKTLDLDHEFKTHDYTVMVMVQWFDGFYEFFQQLEQLRKANPNLGVVSYFENNSHDETEINRRDDEFKAFLKDCGVGWESFIRYWNTMYPEDEAPLYCEYQSSMYPGGNNNVVVIGPENTVVFTTLLLGNMSGDKHEAVIQYLEDVLNSPIDRYESSDYSADKKVEILQKATVGNGLDLVITGDAFSDRLIADGTFEGLARNAAENFFSAEPMKSLRNRFNVYMVKAVSRNEEYFNGCSTAFSGVFGIGSAVGGDNDKVLEYTRAAIPAERMDNALTMVLMNSSKSGGTCYMLNPEDRSVFAAGASIAWLPYKDASAVFGQSGLASTLVHEMGGHGLGKLADEYYYFGMGEISEHSAEDIRQMHERHWYVNVDVTDNPSKVYWSRFIGDSRYADEGIGVYLGGFVYEFGVWRPTDDSIMFRSGSPENRFNAPSRAQLYTRIMKLSEGESWEFDYETFVEWDKAHPDKKAARRRSMVEVGDEEPEHTPPVMVGKTWREAIGHRR